MDFSNDRYPEISGPKFQAVLFQGIQKVSSISQNALFTNLESFELELGSTDSHDHSAIHIHSHTLLYIYILILILILIYIYIYADFTCMVL